MIEPNLDDFERLVRENQRVVYQIAYGVLGNAADAQDVTQDAFVQAHAKLSGLRDPARFSAWVRRIVHRLALNRLRSDSRTRKREAFVAADSVQTADVEALAADREAALAVNAAIDSLPSKLREALVLCAIEGLEPIDVAQMLGIPAGTVRSRLHLARKTLLEKLAP